MISVNLLCNGNGDSNENRKKKKQSPGLEQQNKVFHVHHSSLYIFFTNCFISYFVVDLNTRQLFPNSFFLNLQYNHLEFTFRTTTSYKCDESSLYVTLVEIIGVSLESFRS